MDVSLSRSRRCKVVLIEQYIARLHVDAIVNFERYQDLTGGDLHSLIHKDAGPGLKAECKAKRNKRMMDDGEVLLTGAHNIYNAKGIIHAVVPIIMFSFSKKDAATLALCHERALDVARENKLRTIAFPCMYNFYACKQASVDAALDAVKNNLRRHTGEGIDTVLFCAVDKADTDAYRAVLPKYFPDFVDAARLPIILGKAYVFDYTAVVEVGQYVYFGKEIGRGAFGTVHKGRHKQTHADVAIKIINCDGPDEKGTNIATEIDILKKLSGSSEHLVSVYDVHQTATQISIVMELCNAGDLHEYLNARPAKKLTEDEIRHFLRHIVIAMKALRQMNVIHRDLKPQNMLLHRREHTARMSTFNLTLKIADFGVSRYLSDDAAASTVAGTPVYMAPELLQAYLNRRHGAYTSSVDLWSIGVILYECLTGERPFQGQDLTKMCNYASGFWSRFFHVPISFPQTASGPLQELLKGLLQPRPERRMGFDDFFSNKFCGESATEAVPDREIRQDLRNDGVTAADMLMLEAAREKVAGLWSLLIRDALELDEHIKRAAVVEFSTRTILARSEGPHEFSASEAELEALLDLFACTHKNPPPNHFYLRDLRYEVADALGALVLGTAGTTGVIAAKAHNAVLIAVYDGPVNYETHRDVQNLANTASDILMLTGDGSL